MNGIRSRGWRHAGALAVVGLLTVGSVAVAAPPGGFPPSFAPAPLAAWVRANTDLPLAEIASVSTSGGLAIVSQHSGRENLVEASVWIETLDPELADAEGALSWSSDVEADCAGGRLRFGAANGYAGRKRQGVVVQSIAPDPQWRSPSAGEPSDAIWRVMCGRPVVTAFSALGSTSGAPTPPGPVQAPPLRQRASPEAPQVAAQARPSELEGGATIQLAAMPSAAAGERVRREISSQFAVIIGPRVVQVVRAEIGPRVVYRVLISGLEDVRAAEDLCRDFRRAGQDCLVRPRRD